MPAILYGPLACFTPEVTESAALIPAVKPNIGSWKFNNKGCQKCLLIFCWIYELKTEVSLPCSYRSFSPLHSNHTVWSQWELLFILAPSQRPCNIENIKKCKVQAPALFAFCFESQRKYELLKKTHSFCSGEVVCIDNQSAMRWMLIFTGLCLLSWAGGVGAVGSGSRFTLFCTGICFQFAMKSSTPG